MIRTSPFPLRFARGGIFLQNQRGRYAAPLVCSVDGKFLCEHAAVARSQGTDLLYRDEPLPHGDFQVFPVHRLKQLLAHGAQHVQLLVRIQPVLLDVRLHRIINLQ